MNKVAEDFIKKTLFEAGKIALKKFGRILKTQSKGDQSNIVTEIDLKSEKYLVSRIQKEFSSHNIISEEMGFQDKGSDHTWIIDPIDGSSNYAAGIPWFGILVALLKNWQPREAGIYLPFYDEMYYTRKNQGSFVNGKPIKVSQERRLANVLVSYGIDYSKDQSNLKHEVKIIEVLVRRIRNLRMTNSVVDFCYVASGKLGGYINQNSKIWDLAAPYLLVKEAGGEMTDIDGKQLSFKVNENNYDKNYTYLSASKYLHPKLLSLIFEARRPTSRLRGG